MARLRCSEASPQLAAAAAASPTAVQAAQAVQAVVPVTTVASPALAQAAKALTAVPPAQATTELAAAAAPVALVDQRQAPAMAATAALVSVPPSLARPRPMAVAVAAPLTSPLAAAVALAAAAWAEPAPATPLRGTLRLERSIPAAAAADQLFPVWPPPEVLASSSFAIQFDMAHFAQLDGRNQVTQVIVVNNSDILDDNGQESEAVGIAFCQNLLGADTNWRQTSYNGRIRKNYAGIGFTYDAGRDAFIPPQPYPSWVLNEATCQWEAPASYPEDGLLYRWDEKSGAWLPG
jgi:hypothetical protein